MTTQTEQPAQKYPQSNNGGFKIILSIIAGVFLFYAVQSHLITDLFCAFLSLVFDSYSIQSNSIVPDIIILILFALIIFGIWHCLKFHLAVTIVSLSIWLGAAVYFSDDSQPKHTSLKILSAMGKGE